MNIYEMLEKTAAVLESEAAYQDKLASDRSESERSAMAKELEPVISQYEQFTGEKLSSAQIDDILDQGQDSFVVKMLSKFASHTQNVTRETPAARLGGPSTMLGTKVASEYDNDAQPYVRRGRRRSYEELKAAQENH